MHKVKRTIQLVYYSLHIKTQSDTYNSVAVITYTHTGKESLVEITQSDALLLAAITHDTLLSAENTY